MKPFPWRPGMALTAERTDLGAVIGRVMKVRPDGRLDIYYRSTDNAYIGQTAILAEMCNPDRTDPATLGALLGVVREVWGCPAAQVTPWTRWDPVGCAVVVMGWRCCLNDADDRCFPVGAGHASTEFDALLAAYEAAPVAQ